MEETFIETLCYYLLAKRLQKCFVDGTFRKSFLL